MKNTLRLALLFGVASLLFNTKTAAQFSVGFSTGLNVATQSYHYPEEPQLSFGADYLPAWRAHAHFDWRVSKRLSAGAEAGMSFKGFRTTDITDENGNSIPNASFSKVFNYFEGGLLLKYRLSSRSFRPYLLGGGHFSYLFDGSQNYRNISFNGSPLGSYGQPLDEENFHNTDFSVSGGAGLEFDILPVATLFAESRYQHGLRDISAVSTAEVRNRAFSLTVGCFYNW
jgi:hypothetical protein